MTYEPHEAHVYKRADGSFEIICQTRKCGYRMVPKDIVGKPVNYAEAQRLADEHSRYRFR